MRKIVKGRLEYMLKSYERIKFIVENYQNKNVRQLEIGSGLDNEDIKAIMIALDIERPKRIYHKKEKHIEEKQKIVRHPAIYDNRQFV